VTTEPDPQAQTAALARSVERTGRRVAELDAHVRQIAADLATLAARLAPAEGAEPPVIRVWLLAEDPDQAAGDLDDLITWLGRVYLRYSDAALPSCWLWHADVVEELWWLRNAHAEAVDPERGSWQRVADWHDRQRPGVARRIHKAVGMCELLLHAQGREAADPPRNVPLASASDQIAYAWVTSGRYAAPPMPTDEQLAVADPLDRPEPRRRL
jgi:hypothetical protein